MDHEARRYYPNQQLAAHVLGFANVDGRGIEGLELSLDEQLRGTVASVPAIRDRRGRVVFSEQLLDGSSQQGTDVYLTIDKTIQTIAERELELAVRTFEARAGSVVVMDPTTGELLAVANFPTYNPNDPGRYDPAHRRNRAVTDYFEPGSTVKPFTVAGALAAGTVRTDQLIDCEDGAMQVAEYTIHDSTPYGELTPAQILAHSSNIGTAKIGSSMGRAGLFRTYRRFGFGERTDIPLPGEASGILRHYRRWYEMDAATISFGQGMSSTNLQLASAMSAIANGGQLMRPILVRRTADPGGNATEDTVPQVRRRVVPRAVARLVGDMLTAVTGPDGTGAEAAIEGYLVAGKTGTAQKADYVHGGYAQDQWLASFVGFVPAQDPRLVISVIIDEPVIAYYGGAVAGPVFRRVGEASLRHLGVPAEAGGEALVAHARERREREADEARRRREARAEAGGEPGGEPGGDGADAAPDTALARAEPGAGETRVPDVLGRTARGALRALREASLSVEITGTGLVDAVEPPVGAIVPVGASVLVLLTPPNREVLPVAPAGPELARSDTHRVAGEARP
jgi:cell division protein FtsI (penicillin-binding protein 3)